ncbi:hypothetical protein [Actinomycetospora soli]|uniref:hypothetical protein n=1 Tax=Actinomycetospora soli TaxID=2893887 RepID=UPI001E64C418|nr:hypothetical protein [Actinomycetospora soli]MCD2191654.1 hypothetical protein [Actinomycetospora soli]
MELPIDTDRLVIVASGQVEAVRPWVEGPDGKRRPSEEQDTDEGGRPLWTVHGMIATGDRPTLVAVRVPAPSQPEPAPFAPLAFEHLTAVARVNRSTGQLAVYWSAAGIAGDARGKRQGHDQQQAA